MRNFNKIILLYLINLAQVHFFFFFFSCESSDEEIVGLAEDQVVPASLSPPPPEPPQPTQPTDPTENHLKPNHNSEPGPFLFLVMDVGVYIFPFVCTERGGGGLSFLEKNVGIFFFF